MCSPSPAAAESPLPGHDSLGHDGLEHDGLGHDGLGCDGLDLQIKLIECTNYNCILVLKEMNVLNASIMMDTCQTARNNSL